ncbi:hypothetical protein AAF712_014478 [Marasmius tenuissimus]|uniref:Uncharacterized protein n=1 Tax=Marasmius tenuissimus TaxID=585030 RepID=A0ABR2ZEG7_9AGAR
MSGENVVSLNQKRKQTGKIQEALDSLKPKKKPKNVNKPVVPAKAMKGSLLKNGVPIKGTIKLTKLKAKPVDSYDSNIELLEEPPAKRLCLLSFKTKLKSTGSRKGKGEGTSTQPTQARQSPSVEIEEVEDPEKTPQQALGDTVGHG